MRLSFLALSLFATVGASLAATEPRAVPFSSASGQELPAPWRIVTLPKIPRHTRYAVTENEGRGRCGRTRTRRTPTSSIR